MNEEKLVVDLAETQAGGSADANTSEPKQDSPADGDADSDTPKRSSIAAWTAGIWVGMISLVLVFRLFAVSDWNWEVASFLVDSFNFDDALSILMGTLFERPHITGILVAFLLPFTLFRDYWLARARAITSRTNNWFIILGLLSVVFVLVRSFSMWWVVIVAAVLSAALIVASIVWTKGMAHNTLMRIAKSLGLVTILTILYLAVAVNTPWIPQEIIETDATVHYGYVLDADPGFLRVLTDDREVLLLPDQDVISRTLVD